MFTRHPRCLVSRSIAAGHCLVVCLLVMAAVAAHAAMWSNVTVTTTDGWEYPGMTVESTGGEAAILLINGQGGRKSMPRASIRTIVDAAGRDVTEWVFAGEEPDHAAPATGEENAPRRDPGRIRPPSPTPEAADSEGNVTTPARRRGRRTRGALPERVLVLPSLSAGASGTGGDAFGGLQNGGSLGFALRITAVKNAYIGFDYRRQWLQFESRPSPDDFNRSYPNVHLDELYFVVGAHPQVVRLDKPITFVEVGVGAVFESSEGGFALDYSGGTFPGFFNDTALGVLFAGGVILPLSPGVPGVGVHFGANIRLTESDRAYGNRAGVLFGVTAGFTFLLGDAR